MLNMIMRLCGKYFILSHRSQRMIFIFEILLFVLMAVKAYRDKQVKKYVVCYILYSYVFCILVSTVFARIHWQIWNVKPVDFSKINWWPFYSYSLVAVGNRAYLQEVVMNCCVLFPVGFLLSWVYESLKLSSHVRICFYLSVSIELLQLIYDCGLCELDDIMHNVLGGFLGVCCYRLFRKIEELCKGKLVTVQRLTGLKKTDGVD